MKIIAPDYYREFACIAGACRHSCCIGWEIDVDPVSLRRYQQMQGTMGERLRESIEVTEEGACFRLQGEEERCPFLNQRGLCDLILELGEDALCQICTDHPRFRSFFTGRTEIGLGLCCEEAARLILSRKEPVRLITISNDGKDEALSEEERSLLSLRERLFEKMQDRSQPVEQRIETLMNFAGASARGIRWTQQADFLLSLERLDDAWTDALEKLRDASDGMPTLSGLQTEMEQLMIALLYRHLPGALEDGNVRGRILLCVYLWLVTAQLCSVNRVSEAGDAAQWCRLASSELEYSEENTQALLAWADELSAFD